MNLLAEMARAVAAVTADDMDNPDVSAVDFDRVRAALSAALKHGWKLVPVEPTEHMIVRGDERIIEALNDHTGILRNPTPAHDSYREMISAAPPIGGE